MNTCPNCGRYLAYPLSGCKGGRRPFCGYKPGDYDEAQKDARKEEAKERKESPWIGWRPHFAMTPEQKGWYEQAVRRQKQRDAAWKQHDY